MFGMKSAAVDWLNAHEGTVLLTTGSKELEAYTAVQDFQTRLFPRVLPSASVLEKCAALGFPGAHIIAMQGPFSQAMNAALLRETGAKILVTKDTGVSGGFAEKVAAAKEVSAKVLVIARPREEQGRNQAEMQEFLTDLLGLQPEKVQRTFTIIGAGMGTMDTLTGEAVRALETAEAVFATKRLAVLSPKAEVCAFSELAERAISGHARHTALLVRFRRCGILQRGRKAARAAPAIRRGNTCAGIVKHAVYMREMRHFLRKSVF